MARITLGTHGFLHLRRYRFLPQDINTHKHVIGTTGQGKSKFLTNLILQLRSAGIPFCLIDPHGELADEALALLSPDVNNRPEELVYVELGRSDAFLPFNILDQPYAVDKIQEHIIQVCLRAWPSLAG